MTTQQNNKVISIILRFTLALAMFPHGAQKTFGWFGGYGFSGTMDFFTSKMGLPWLVAFGVVLLEFLGPILLVLGLGTRILGALFAALMAGAIYTSHWGNGFFMNWSGSQKGEGFEYHLLIIGLGLALTQVKGQTLAQLLHRQRSQKGQAPVAP